MYNMNMLIIYMILTIGLDGICQGCPAFLEFCLFMGKRRLKKSETSTINIFAHANTRINNYADAYACTLTNSQPHTHPCMH